MAALRERALRHGQSMQQEIRQILAAAASQSSPAESQEPIPLVMVQTTSPATRRREEIYDDTGR